MTSFAAEAAIIKGVMPCLLTRSRPGTLGRTAANLTEAFSHARRQISSLGTQVGGLGWYSG